MVFVTARVRRQSWSFSKRVLMPPVPHVRTRGRRSTRQRSLVGELGSNWRESLKRCYPWWLDVQLNYLHHGNAGAGAASPCRCSNWETHPRRPCRYCNIWNWFAKARPFQLECSGVHNTYIIYIYICVYISYHELIACAALAMTQVTFCWPFIGSSSCDRMRIRCGDDPPGASRTHLILSPGRTPWRLFQDSIWTWLLPCGKRLHSYWKIHHF